MSIHCWPRLRRRIPLYGACSQSDRSGRLGLSVQNAREATPRTGAVHTDSKKDALIYIVNPGQIFYNQVWQFTKFAEFPEEGCYERNGKNCGMYPCIVPCLMVCGLDVWLFPFYRKRSGNRCRGVCGAFDCRRDRDMHLLDH